MTNEEKRLLFKVLCEMLPYGVIIQVYFEDISADGYFDEALWSLELDGVESAHVNDRWIENIKPYLRQMSSMTEKEGGEYELLIDCSDHTYFKTSDKVIDWLNAHHFDYRGLIEKGLALKAPDGMYKF